MVICRIEYEDLQVEKPMKADPQSAWMLKSVMRQAKRADEVGKRTHAQTMQTISVLLRLVPLKQSRYLVPSDTALSMALVCAIMARVCSTCSGGARELRRRRSEERASSGRECRTSHQGDSGAKKQAMRIGTGHI